MTSLINCHSFSSIKRKHFVSSSSIINPFCIMSLITLIIAPLIDVESRSISLSGSGSDSDDYGLLSDYLKMLSDSTDSSPSDRPTSGKLKDSYLALITACKQTISTAERVKMIFLKNVIRSSDDFETSVSSWREDWLPIIPAATEKNFITKYDSPEDALHEAFHYLQHYVIGMQQILTDIMLHDGKMWNQFNMIYIRLHQIVCEIRIGMQITGIKPKIDPKIVAKEFKDISNSSRRITRDYLILRDFIETINYLLEMFSFLKLKHLEDEK